MEECIFCKIVSGDIPCAQVYADEAVLSFLDIAPIAEGHTLVIPRTHYPTLWDVPKEEGDHLLAVLQKVGRAVLSASRATGLNVVMNNYASAGQVVPHAHWHLIPRKDGDGLMRVVQQEYGSQEAMQAMAEKLRAALDNSQS
jgi:histidine triad (HIT) family protein